MKEYYFKVSGDKAYYCSISAENYYTAKRNLIFACFSYREDEPEMPFKKRVDELEDRWSTLSYKYSHRVTDTSKEKYEQMDLLQNE